MVLKNLTASMSLFLNAKQQEHLYHLGFIGLLIIVPCLHELFFEIVFSEV
jgi:membrane protease YdiL (CAAX protease family)